MTMHLMQKPKLSSRLTLEAIIVEAAEAARPPERLTVSEAAERYRHLNNPGAYVGPLKNDITPYLIEPMDTLQSLDFTAMCFVGPAQCAKTEMVLNWLTYSAVCDPADMMIIQTSQTTARDFSMRRIDRLHKHSPDIGSRLVKSSDSDNVFDKHYKSGMMLTLSWPTVNELSGKPIPRLWLTDYDRMPQDVDKEGSPFSLARMRATTFRSNGMTVIESSPGFVVDNPKHIVQTRHEAMPTKGILAVYNQGDRRRWYWQCVNCQKTYEPDFNLLIYPDIPDVMGAAEATVLRCPYCSFDIKHDPEDGKPGKHEMNKHGRWVRDGMTWNSDGTMTGTPYRSSIASFWLKGVAAAFSDWKTLVANYITAERTYESNGTEEALKTTINTDQGLPYVPKSSASDRVPEELKSRARGYQVGEVPAGVRFLIASIDVQKNRFVVQVHGVHINGDRSVIDRFEIRKSKRLDADGEHYWVNPGAHSEDWKLIGEQVLAKTYPLSDNSGRHMNIKFTVCDSGGKEGVTANAYEFVRWLKNPDEEATDTAEESGEYVWDQGFSGRFMLLKGDPSPLAPRIRVGFPDSQRKDRHAGARGEVPVLFINSNMNKDTLNHMLDRKEPGGRINFPLGLSDNFYVELTVEVKLSTGKWDNPKNFRNESWDLLAYMLAACLLPQVNFERMAKDDPPGWAAEWDYNDLVFDPVVQEKSFDAATKPRYDLSKLASRLA